MPHHVPRGLGAAALCAAVVLLATTLGVHAAATDHRGSARPVIGGTLRIAYSGAMSTFDPTQSFYEDWYVMMGSLYDGLYVIDRNGRPQLDLAAAPPQVTANRKTWTFLLRRGVRFDNGLELTASDVKYSIMRTLDPHLKPAVSWGQPADNIFAGSQDFIDGKVRDVKGIEILNRYTIRFVLAQPVAVFPYILAASYNFVIPQAVVSRESPDAIASHPIGT